MKEYRVKVWDNEDGPEYVNTYPVPQDLPVGLFVDDLNTAGWDNVVLESREVSEWEEV